MGTKFAHHITRAFSWFALRDNSLGNAEARACSVTKGNEKWTCWVGIVLDVEMEYSDSKRTD